MKKFYTIFLILLSELYGFVGLAQPLCNSQFQFYTGNNPDSIYFRPDTISPTAHYYWSFGDGSHTTNIDPWHWYSIPGTYYACLTMTDSNSTGTCSSTWCDSIQIVPVLPHCNAQFYHYSSNNPDSIHFYISGNSSTATYSWSFGDGGSSTLLNPWHLYAGPGSYYVCLTVTDSNAAGTCSSTWCDSLHIIVPTLPLCNAQFQYYAGNNPDSINFRPDTIFPHAHYYWSFGDGTHTTNIDPWHWYSSPGTYYACLTVTDSNAAGSCTSTWCDSIQIVPVLPHCNAQFYHYSSNNPDSIHFYVSGNSSTATYSWSFGDGGSSTLQSPWHLYAGPGSYYVCLTVTDSNAAGTCSSTWCDSLHIIAPTLPLCNAQFQYYAGNNPDSINFRPDTIFPHAHYYWSFGDGTHTTNIDPWHWYSSPGTYYACLTVTDSNAAGSCTSTWCDSIQIVPVLPHCNAQFYHYSSNNPDSIHFYVSGNSSTATYSWSFGDGGSSTLQSPWHLYAGPGSYYVCLTVTDSNAAGTCSSTWCDSLHIIAPTLPLCNAQFQYYAGNNPDSINFRPDTIFPHAHYYWSFGDGSHTTNIDPWHWYSTPGTYYACLTVTDSNAAGTCTSTWCDSIQIVPVLPHCNAQFYHYSSNNPDSIHFYVSGNSSTATYSWSFGDGGSSTLQYPWHLYAGPGSYYVCLTVTDSNAAGTCSSTWCDSLHIIAPTLPLCNAQFQYYAGNNPDSINFRPDTIFPHAHYYWSFGDGSHTTNIDPWHWYSSPGTYYACLTVTDSNAAGSCISTWCDSIYIVPVLPHCNAQFYHYSSNNPDSIHFYVSGNSSTATYSWSFGDGGSSTLQSPWHLYAGPGSYYVCLTVTDSNAAGTCTSTWCDSLHIIAPTLPLCNAQFQYYAGNNPDSINFQPDTISSTANYYWSFGDGTYSNHVDPWHWYPGTGSYVACLTVTDSNAAGTCTSTWCDTVNIPIHFAPHVTIAPNPITTSSVVLLENVSNPVTFRINSPTGQLIYQKNNVSNGSFIIRTDDYSPGIYYYSIHDDNEIISIGRLIIIRN